MFFHFGQKFKMAAIFGERKFFLKLVNSTLLRYPVGRKFRRNRSISHGYGDRGKYVGFFTFGKNSKWPPFLKRVKFFENWQEYIDYIPCGSKISPKSGYLARLRRYTYLCFLLCSYYSGDSSYYHQQQ